MKGKRLIFFILFVMALSGYGCCLKDVKIDPSIGGVDLATKTVTTAGVPITIDFSSCCIDGDEKDMIKSLETKLVEDVDKVRNGQLSVDQYNKNRDAIADGIKQINERCKALAQKISETKSKMKTELK